MKDFRRDFSVVEYLETEYEQKSEKLIIEILNSQPDKRIDFGGNNVEAGCIGEQYDEDDMIITGVYLDRNNNIRYTTPGDESFNERGLKLRDQELLVDNTDLIAEMLNQIGQPL